MGKNLKELAAIGMIGEGLTGALQPREHLLLWERGPLPYRRVIHKMAHHPGWMRLLFAVEAGLGVWWAMRLIER